MLPSKKIFIGASAIITGYLFQWILVWLLRRAAESAVDGIGTGGSAGVDVDERLEQLHEQLEQLHEQVDFGFNAMTFSYVFIISGVVFVLVGIYQTARGVEALRAEAGAGV